MAIINGRGESQLAYKRGSRMRVPNDPTIGIASVYTTVHSVRRVAFGDSVDPLPTETSQVNR